MKLNYEIYLVEEQEDDLREECKSSIDTFKKAGMDSLVENLEAEEVVMPFSALESTQSRLLKAVFYNTTYPKNFDKLLPIQVASVIALCNEKKYFKNLYIRSDVGVNNLLLSSYIVMGTDAEGTDYLVARWSAGPLESIEDIKEKARPIIKSKLKVKIEENLGKANGDLQRIDDLVDEYIDGGYVGYYL